MEEAIHSGDLERVRELIRSGAAMNARQGYREGSLLHLAIQEGYKDITLALLDAKCLCCGQFAPQQPRLLKCSGTEIVRSCTRIYLREE